MWLEHHDEFAKLNTFECSNIRAIYKVVGTNLHRLLEKESVERREKKLKGKREGLPRSAIRAYVIGSSWPIHFSRFFSSLISFHFSQIKVQLCYWRSNPFSVTPLGHPHLRASTSHWSILTLTRNGSARYYTWIVVFLWFFAINDSISSSSVKCFFSHGISHSSARRRPCTATSATAPYLSYSIRCWSRSSFQCKGCWETQTSASTTYLSGNFQLHMKKFEEKNPYFLIPPLWAYVSCWKIQGRSNIVSPQTKSTHTRFSIAFTFLALLKINTRMNVPERVIAHSV